VRERERERERRIVREGRRAGARLPSSCRDPRAREEPDRVEEREKAYGE